MAGTIHCWVTTLRERGRRLRTSEYPAPLEGDLTVSDLPPRSSWKRQGRYAFLVVREGGGPKRTALTIFEPQLLETVDGGFLLEGVQLVFEGGEMSEHRQLWLVHLGAPKGV